MGKFVIRTTATGVKFDLQATNAMVIGTSQVYSSEAACASGIESVRKACVGEVEDQTVEGYTEQKHPKFEVYQDKAGDFRFRLKARNGEIVLSSEAYKALKTCLNGVQSVKKNAPEASVVTE